MTLSTKNYDMFVFRNDNREKIDWNHVRKLMHSIKSKNMLDLNPIIVNEKMEIINGQHRTLAAKELQVPIYYTIQKNSTPFDVMLLGVNKNWTTGDIVNYWAKNGKIEYQKLIDFCKKSQLPIAVGLKIVNKKYLKDIRSGNYVFNPSEEVATIIENCHQLIDVIKSNVGEQYYLKAGKFWRALTAITKDPSYTHDKMIHNLQILSNRFTQKASYQGYLEMFISIHNYRNPSKILININEVKDIE